MKKFLFSLLIFVLIAGVMTVFSGLTHGAQVTMKQEGGAKMDREGVPAAKDMNNDGNRLTFIPERQKDTKDSGTQATKGDASRKIQRYSPYQYGEGENK